MIQLYARQIFGIAVLLAIIGGYYYWKHEVSEQGHAACMADVKRRDDYTMEQSIRIKQEAKQEYEEERIKNETNYNNAIRTYADYANRMRVTAEANRTSGSKVRVPTEASCPESYFGSSEETLSIKAVELIIEKICLPNMEIK